MTRLVLGSASPGRLKVLRDAGIEPLVIASHVDEDVVIAALGPDAVPSDVVCVLAAAKAAQVATTLTGTQRIVAADCVVAYALWVFTLFGHADVRLLNGGRDLWLAERRETTLDVPTKTCTGYPVVQRNDAPIRAFRDDVLAILGAQPLIDVRSPEEYTGKRTHMPDYPEEGALRAGHIPTAVHIPWGKAADESGRFRSREELERLYDFINPDDQTVVYCRIGERSSHTWFVLTHLLGKADVRNYDGSWTEWGNAVRVPIVAGEEPGVVPVV